VGKSAVSDPLIVDFRRIFITLLGFNSESDMFLLLLLLVLLRLAEIKVIVSVCRELVVRICLNLTRVGEAGTASAEAWRLRVFAVVFIRIVITLFNEPFCVTPEHLISFNTTLLFDVKPNLLLGMDLLSVSVKRIKNGQVSVGSGPLDSLELSLFYIDFVPGLFKILHLLLHEFVSHLPVKVQIGTQLSHQCGVEA